MTACMIANGAVPARHRDLAPVVLDRAEDPLDDERRVDREPSREPAAMAGGGSRASRSRPGLTVCTAIPRGASSTASERENASCACFDAEYGPAGDLARDRDDVHDVRAAAEAGQERVRRPRPSRGSSTRIIASIPSGSPPTKSVRAVKPALFTSRSMRSWRASTRAASASTATRSADVALLVLVGVGRAARRPRPCASLAAAASGPARRRSPTTPRSRRRRARWRASRRRATSAVAVALCPELSVTVAVSVCLPFVSLAVCQATE